MATWIHLGTYVGSREGDGTVYYYFVNSENVWYQVSCSAIKQLTYGVWEPFMVRTSPSMHSTKVTYQ